jgi:hypothetical protein
MSRSQGRFLGVRLGELFEVVNLTSVILIGQINLQNNFPNLTGIGCSPNKGEQTVQSLDRNCHE